MDDQALANYVRSAQLNRDTRKHAECLNAGVKPETLGLHERGDGWVVIGWFCAGKRSAWVQAHKIRNQFPNLETKVFDTADMPVEWKAELGVRHKATSKGEKDVDQSL